MLLPQISMQSDPDTKHPQPRTHQMLVDLEVKAPEGGLVIRGFGSEIVKGRYQCLKSEGRSEANLLKFHQNPKQGIWLMAIYATHETFDASSLQNF